MTLTSKEKMRILHIVEADKFYNYPGYEKPPEKFVEEYTSIAPLGEHATKVAARAVCMKRNKEKREKGFLSNWH